MAKPQFILAVSIKHLIAENTQEGFQTLTGEEYNQFLKRALRYTTLRQRDYLDGVGIKGVEAAINAMPGGYTFKGTAEFNQEKMKLELEDGTVVDVNSSEKDIYLTTIHIAGDPEEFTNLLFIQHIEGEPRVCFFPDVIDVEIETFMNGDDTYRQLLPYTVFKVKGEDKYFTYRRTSKVGESRLSGNCSIGFGGHIDLADVVCDTDTSELILDETIRDASLRELDEEIVISDELHDLVVNEKIEPILFGLINDNSNAVGQLHLGIVNVYEVDESDILDVNEDELEFLGALTAEEILNNNPESWTKLIVEHLT